MQSKAKSAMSTCKRHAVWLETQFDAAVPKWRLLVQATDSTMFVRIMLNTLNCKVVCHCRPWCVNA